MAEPDPANHWVAPIELHDAARVEREHVMAGTLAGKVASITSAARGTGADFVIDAGNSAGRVAGPRAGAVGAAAHVTGVLAAGSISACWTRRWRRCA